MGREEPLFLPDHEVDPLEVKIRLVCGVLLGVFIGFGAALRLNPTKPIWFALILLVAVVGCAWGAVRQGDRFWIAVLGRFR